MRRSPRALLMLKRRGKFHGVRLLETSRNNLLPQGRFTLKYVSVVRQ
jgi:hypothetical protein